MANEVTNFMYYMYNKWDKEECINLFGEMLGNHIFAKWVHYNGNLGELRFYAELDGSIRQRLVDRANELYRQK